MAVTTFVSGNALAGYYVVRYDPTLPNTNANGLGNASVLSASAGGTPTAAGVETVHKNGRNAAEARTS